jgi:hypothetical protein
MRGMWIVARGLGVALLCLPGCWWNSEEHLRPPKRPEEFLLPPEDDPRFSSAPSYPKGLLNRDYLKKDQEREDNGPGGSGRGAHFGAPGVPGAAGAPGSAGGY